MGGTSAINDMIYARGNKQDFDDWASYVGKRWDYNEVLKYFKKLEDIRVSLF